MDAKRGAKGVQKGGKRGLKWGIKAMHPGHARGKKGAQRWDKVCKKEANRGQKGGK